MGVLYSKKYSNHTNYLSIISFIQFLYCIRCLVFHDEIAYEFKSNKILFIACYIIIYFVCFSMQICFLLCLHACMHGMRESFFFTKRLSIKNCYLACLIDLQYIYGVYYILENTHCMVFNCIVL